MKYAWEGTLVAIIASVIAVLALVSHITAHPDSPPSAQSEARPVPGISAIPPISRTSSRKTLRAAQRPPDFPKPAKPLEVVLGPSSIEGQFTVLGAHRTSVTPTSDQLTLHLRVSSRALPDLVTPLQYVTLEVYTPALDPIAAEHSFSHPVPAGATRDEDVAFLVPSSLALDRSFLRIHFYNEQKDIALSLLAPAAAVQAHSLDPQ